MDDQENQGGADWQQQYEQEQEQQFLEFMGLLPVGKTVKNQRVLEPLDN